MGSLVTTPIALFAHYVLGVDDTTTFILAAIALMPLAWLIGEATEHVAEHTGPGVGGFFNASFGNAPELIIALLAVHSGLPDVVRGSIVGSVVSNLLLVLGLTMFFGVDGEIDRRSLFLQLALVGVAIVAFLVPSIPGWDGDPDRHDLYLVTIPVSIVLLLIYIGVTIYNLRLHRASHVAEASAAAWTMRSAVIVLAIATVATAFVAELVVGSLEEFGHQVGLSEFFVSVVIVAIVGNAAEHGGAVIVAARGKITLAVEIALASSAQVAVFLIPAVALLSWLIEPLALSFRVVEMACLGGAIALVSVVLYDGRTSRLRGAILVAAYVGIAIVFLAAGDRTV
jgi:Ca2+:H+ antiporter